MTLAELHRLHADEVTGGFDYCIMSDVREDGDLCIVDIDAKTPPTTSKAVVALTALNTAAEAVKVKLAAADIEKLGLTVKPKDIIVEKEIPLLL